MNKDDEQQLQPAPCGHIHYLRRTLLLAMGVDLQAHDDMKAAAGDDGHTEVNLGEVWALDKEFTEEVYADADKIIESHQNAGQYVERLDEHFRFLALLRLAQAMKNGDPKLYRVVRVLMLDALMSDMNEQARKEGIAKLVQDLFGGAMPAPEDPDAPAPGTKKH